MHAARDHQLERRVEHAQPAGDAEHLVGERPALLLQQEARHLVPLRRHFEHEGSQLGADREAVPLDPLEEAVEVGHAERSAEGARERRVGARRLSHAGAGPECSLDDVTGAAELAEALGHRARRLPGLVAACGDRPRARRRDTPGLSRDAGAQRREGVVGDEALTAEPEEIQRVGEVNLVSGPVDAREREDGGLDIAARAARLAKRVVDGERDRIDGGGQADALPVRAARTAAADHAPAGRHDHGVGLGRAAVDPDHRTSCLGAHVTPTGALRHRASRTGPRCRCAAAPTRAVRATRRDRAGWSSGRARPGSDHPSAQPRS